MNIKASLLLFLTIFLTLPIHAGNSVPRIYLRDNLEVRAVGPQMTCSLVLNSPHEDLLLPQVKDIISFANEGFAESRDWTEEFRNDRFKIAKNYQANSHYYEVYEDTHRVGSLGLTYAYKPGQQVPLEETLNLTLPTPKLVEFRTYRIVSENSRLVFSHLFSSALENVFEVMRDQKLDYYNENVISTYADKKSLRLYGMMGFEVLESVTPLNIPKHVMGTDWWVMVISPQKLQELVRRSTEIEAIGGFNEVITVKNKYLGDVQLSPHTQASFGGDVGGRDLPISIQSTAQKMDLGKGIVADVGSEIFFIRPGILHWVSKLAYDVDLGVGIVARKGTAIALYPNGNIMHVERLAQDVEIQRQLFEKGQGLSLKMNGQPQ